MRQFLENKYATIFSIETKEYMQQSISDKTITKQADRGGSQQSDECDNFSSLLILPRGCIFDAFELEAGMTNHARGGANFSGTKVSNVMREALATPAEGV